MVAWTHGRGSLTDRPSHKGKYCIPTLSIKEKKMTEQVDSLLTSIDNTVGASNFSSEPNSSQMFV